MALLRNVTIDGNVDGYCYGIEGSAIFIDIGPLRFNPAAVLQVRFSNRFGIPVATSDATAVQATIT